VKTEVLRVEGHRRIEVLDHVTHSDRVHVRSLPGALHG
jgi:hypothetical protein